MELGKVIQAYKNKNYKYNALGINLFGIRSKDEFTDMFDDTIGIAHNLNGTPELITIPGTTKGGFIGQGAASNPIPGGIAVIEPGQYLNVWQWVDGIQNPDGSWDYSKLWLKYPYMGQIGTFRIWRDGNKDKIIDHTNDQAIQWAGLNFHRMSWDGVEGQPYVGNWSEGCQGAEEPEFKKLLPIIRDCVKRYGNIFSYTLFEQKDFI